MRRPPIGYQGPLFPSPVDGHDGRPGQADGASQVADRVTVDPADRKINDRFSPGIGCSVELLLLRSMLKRLGDPPIRVILWNGEEVATAPSPPIGCVKIHDRATLWKLAWNQSLTFGDAYAAGR